MNVKSLFRQNLVFFLGYVILLVVAVFILALNSKAEGFLLLNPLHTRPLDYFFIPYTYFGDGIFVIALGVMFLLLKRKWLGMMILSSYAVSGIIAQVLKYFIVEARPAFYLEKSGYPYFIDGVTLHNFHSFPSGHTASIFALAAILSFSGRNKKFSLLLLLLAALVGYSRIYLGQHFMEDVLAGSVVGVISAVLCWVCFDRPFKRILKIED